MKLWAEADAVPDSTACERTQVLNPLLPHGSGVRNVLSHIENPEGSFYLLHLQPEQAQILGWRR